MTTSEFADLWPEIVAVRPRKVVFTGGEPLLRGDILDLLSDLSSADPNQTILRCLNTNGYLVTEELARDLVGLADEVRVSLDAMRERNDRIRGGGSFDMAVDALERLYSVGFEPIVLITITSHTLPDLANLLVFLNKKKFNRIHVNEFKQVGRGKQRRDFRVEPNEVYAIMRRLWDFEFPDLLPLPKPIRFSELSNCGAGSFINILPDGTVYPCHVLMAREFRCGNIRKQSLFEMCCRDGLLGRLAGLNFRDLGDTDETLLRAFKHGTCTGEFLIQEHI